MGSDDGSLSVSYESFATIRSVYNLQLEPRYYSKPVASIDAHRGATGRFVVGGHLVMVARKGGSMKRGQPSTGDRLRVLWCAA